MRVTPERQLLVERKQLAVAAAGTSGCNDIARITDFLSRTGGFRDLLCTAAIAKNPTEINRLGQDTARHYSEFRRRFGDKGLVSYRHHGQRLGGPGKEFMKRVDLAMRLLPFYARDVRAASRWLSRALAGQAELLLQVLSSGGHVVAQKLFENSVAASITRPPLVVNSVIRPLRTDLAAEVIFKEQMRLMFENRLAGADLLIVRDNERAGLARPRELQDKIATAAMMSPFSARKTETWMPAVEVYDALKRPTGFVGIWGVRLDFQVYKVRRGFFRQAVKDEFQIVDQCLEGIQSVVEDDRTSFTGLPAAEGGQSIFSIVGNVTRRTFETVEDEVRGQGPCLFVPAPMAHIYVTRLANVDDGVLAADLGVPRQSALGGANGYTSGLEQALETVAERIGSSVEAARRPWDRRN